MFSFPTIFSSFLKVDIKFKMKRNWLMTATIGYFVAMHSTSRGDFDSYYAELSMPFVIAFTLTKIRLRMFGYSVMVWFLQTSYLAKDLLHFWLIIVLAVILYFFILFFSKCVHAMSAIRCCERISAAALVTQMAFRISVLTTTDHLQGLSSDWCYI